MYTKGDFLPFLTQPIAAIFLSLALLSIILKIRDNYKKKKTIDSNTIGL
jgi:putative tricarboxylic transport membrane protein